jgi:hypothetical protein
MNSKTLCLGLAAFGVTASLSVATPSEAAPRPVLSTPASAQVVQQVDSYKRKHYKRDKYGEHVRAPFASVDDNGKDTWVAAPFARVYDGRRGTWVRAPFVNLWVPR